VPYDARSLNIDSVGATARGVRRSWREWSLGVGAEFFPRARATLTDEIRGTPRINSLSFRKSQWISTSDARVPTTIW
jgi:hypothetical protein